MLIKGIKRVFLLEELHACPTQYPNASRRKPIYFSWELSSHGYKRASMNLSSCLLTMNALQRFHLHISTQHPLSPI